MTWIQTVTGRKFDLLNPRAEDVCIEDIAGPLSRICRWGGQCNAFYSVAQHSVGVARMLARSGASPRLQLIGLLHDAHEAYVGDIVTPLKRVAFVSGLAREECTQCGQEIIDEDCSFDALSARIQLEIFRALVPGMEDGCETGAEAQVWHRADTVALVTEFVELHNYPPLDNWLEMHAPRVRPDGSYQRFMRSRLPIPCENAEWEFMDSFRELREEVALDEELQITN